MRTAHSAMRGILLPFLKSREAFTLLRGMPAKAALVRLLIDLNSELDARTQPVLGLVGLRSWPPPLLVEQEGLGMVADWFTTSLTTETKVWLANTLTAAANHRVNEFNLPWDFNDAGVCDLLLCYSMYVFVIFSCS